MIALSQKIFAALEVGALDQTAFVVAKTAKNADQHIVFDDNSGTIYYDPDGAGGEAQIAFAKLQSGFTATDDDFLVVVRPAAGLRRRSSPQVFPTVGAKPGHRRRTRRRRFRVGGSARAGERRGRLAARGASSASLPVISVVRAPRRGSGPGLPRALIRGGSP